MSKTNKQKNINHLFHVKNIITPMIVLIEKKPMTLTIIETSLFPIVICVEVVSGNELILVKLLQCINFVLKSHCSMDLAISIRVGQFLTESVNKALLADLLNKK